MWANVGTYTYKCDICGTENVVQNYGDWACRQCLQGYTYDECHRISLTDAQLALLRNPPRWIPVEERLPEDGGRFLVVVNSDGDPYADAANWWHGDWWTGESPAQKHACPITHWMPLPEPPEVK
jgi:hypothetical protein